MSDLPTCLSANPFIPHYIKDLGQAAVKVILSSDAGNRGLSKASISASLLNADGDCACMTEVNRLAFPLSFPIFYSLELTPACNNLCPGCGNVFANDRTPRPLASAEWETVLAKLKPHASRLKITGGEPTLHPEFETIVESIRKLDIPFTLFTNARWPEPQRLLTFFENMPQFGGFLISLHGATSYAHEAFTGVPGSFKETVTNIRQAVTAGLSVTTSTVITKQNYNRVNQIVALSKELSANHAVFNRYLGQRLPDIEPTNEELKEAIQAIERLHAAGYPIKFGNCIPQCFYPSSSTGCLAGVAYCTVDPWGNVRPCNHASLTCGNLLEQSLEEVWNSSEMERWRGMIPAQCVECAALSQCHGGCRAMMMELGLEKDPLADRPVVEPAASSAEELVLYEGAYPLGHYSMRSEPFGYVLVRGDRVVPIMAEAWEVLEALDGQSTLRQIKARFGEIGLAFVGALYAKGMVELLSEAVQ